MLKQVSHNSLDKPLHWHFITNTHTHTHITHARIARVARHLYKCTAVSHLFLSMYVSICVCKHTKYKNDNNAYKVGSKSALVRPTHKQIAHTRTRYGTSITINYLAYLLVWNGKRRLCLCCTELAGTTLCTILYVYATYTSVCLLHVDMSPAAPPPSSRVKANIFYTVRVTTQITQTMSTYTCNLHYTAAPRRRRPGARDARRDRDEAGPSRTSLMRFAPDYSNLQSFSLF